MFYLPSNLSVLPSGDPKRLWTFRLSVDQAFGDVKLLSACYFGHAFGLHLETIWHHLVPDPFLSFAG